MKKTYIIILLILLLVSACSTSKFIPDGNYLLSSVELRSTDKKFDAAQLEPYIRQHANSKWFSAFKIPLAAYSLSGKDSTKWINRTLQKIGEAPVVYDTIQAKMTCDDLRNALYNLGYMHGDVTLETKVRKHKVKAIYTLHPNEPYYINHIRYDIQDKEIAQMLRLDKEENRGLHRGTQFTVSRLDQERERITNILLDSGFYRFHKDYIQYSADSARYSQDVNITLHLLPYRPNDDSEELPHPRYFIRDVRFHQPDSGTVDLRQSVLEQNTLIEANQPYSAKNLQRTYNNFARLQAVRYTNIQFREVPDTNLLDADIQISLNKKHAISFQPEGTNTAGDLGAAATVSYQNRNLFKGSELLSIQLRAAFEAITGLEGYKDQDYQEYGIEAKLTFPRFLIPFLKKQQRRRIQASSEIALGYNLQNRPEFHRRVFTAAWRYRWSVPHRNANYRLDVIDLNYIYMPWVSETFKHDYLDSVSNRNAILRYNYEDLFITKIGFGMSWSNENNALRINVETSGNVLQGLAKTGLLKKNDEGHYTLFNIAFAQYAKFDFDYTRLQRFDKRNALALHAGFGIAYPYGNSDILPFEKRYFAGGANSVRGWSVRSLGPGSFKGSDGRIDFINQTGDLRLDLNAELRSFLFWKIDGAVFIDAGNIWTLRDYADQPGGQFKWNKFYKQIAVAYGLGLRLNFDYFILRFDAGMKAINPAYTNSKEHYPIAHHDFSRDFSFHFAVGLPF